MLNFPTSWRFEPPGEALPSAAIGDFAELISRMATQGDRWDIVEHFKAFFSRAAGIPFYRSSSSSWADSDLDSAMTSAARNAPLFIEAFYDACQDLHRENPIFGVASAGRINRILGERCAGFEIRSPDLIYVGNSAAITAPQIPPSFDEQAQALVQRSLQQSEQLLLEGRYRQAVGEILWLLETVSTAFRGLDSGLGTVQEKYFNKIAQELRRQHKGQALEHILNWMTTLHGFLSSPTGGGVRHGTDIRDAAEMPSGDAHLYCNLIRSYVGYLMAEHDRMTRRPNSATRSFPF